MAMNAVVDERTLREIYLTGFEIAVKEGQPGAVMSSYNQVNGTYANENVHLLKEILRKEWGYAGIVVTDWGGSNSHTAGVAAGSDLEMPAPGLSSARELVAAVKAVPVASFVILVLLWVPSRNLSVVISVLIGFPVIYSNVLAGLDSTDSKLIEMAKVFRVPFGRQLRAIYLYAVMPFLQSGLSVAMGLCWKSGVAAEVIGIPGGSIGEKLYKAKVYLETPDLFCWTLVIVLLSIGCEKLVARLMKLLVRKAEESWRS